MFSINLKDNNGNGEIVLAKENNKSAIKKALSSINNVNLSALKEKNIIVFPSKTAEADLSDKDKVICSVSGLESDKPKIKTTNVMGFLSLENVCNISITSRFDNNNKNYFLHYMLSKVCNAAPIIKTTPTNNNPFYDFIVYLFPHFLKKALAQGVYRTYRNFEYNDANIHGPIDFMRHIKNNIPFNGKIAYRTREHSADNAVMQLIRHTVEFIAEKNDLRVILHSNKETRETVKKIREYTPSYRASHRSIIISRNLRKFTHPFYTEYETLYKLCLMILRRDRVSYGEKTKDMFNGILFDGSALWEEYLNTVLQKNVVYETEHPNNRLRSTNNKKYYLFDSREQPIFPDFIIRKDNNIVSIADAKYKRLEDGANRDDYFQMLSYMYRFDTPSGQLLYPANDNKKTKSFRLDNDKDITIQIIGFAIPKYNNGSYEDFAKEMEKAEKDFLKKIYAFNIQKQATDIF